MAAVLLDASAVLAALLQEPGGEAVDARFAEAEIGAVNASEVVAKLVDRGQTPAAAEAALRDTLLPVRGFGPADAMRAGRLRAETRGRGLSLADRACLAQAAGAGLPVLTADRAWAGLDIGIEVEVIR